MHFSKAALIIASALALTASAAGAQPQARATAPAVTVVAVGDIACPPGAATTATTCKEGATAKLAASLNPDAVFALGDTQYDKGTYSEFTGSYDKTWGALKSITRPVPGNHEYMTAGAAGYYKYFAPRIPDSADGLGYYTSTVGSWRVYNLNSNCTKINCAAQVTWFKKQLATNNEKCTVMLMHFPRYSSGKHGSQTSVAPLWRAAYAAKVDLALAGHDHDYERFKRRDGDNHAEADGIPSFVIGTGGQELRPLGTRRAGSAYVLTNHYGVLRLSLGAGNFSYSFLGIDGKSYDGGTRNCV